MPPGSERYADLRFLKRKAGAHTPHRHRNGRSTGLLLFLGAAGLICWQFVRQQPSFEPFPSVSAIPANSHLADKAAGPAISPLPYPNNRSVYHYSVIPGGVASPDELRNAALQDPVVARHFRGFNYDHAHLVRVSQKRSAYVSYRIGDRVHWTRHKIALHPGEMLITDDTIVARTRCGNRVAAAPLDAGSPLEPSLEELEEPRASAGPRLPAAFVDPIPSRLPDPSIPEHALAQRGGIPWFIPPVFIPTGSSGGPGQPLAVTPEPGSLLLISSGLAGVCWRVRKFKKRP